MTIGIFGGSFNPVHNGHVALAEAIANTGIVDEVWLMLSPCNPLKATLEQASDRDRLAMLELACAGSRKVKASDVELHLPRPSYTISTLNHLQLAYPQHRFRLIIGADNLLIFDRWRQSSEIIERFAPIVYPRPGYDVPDNAVPQGVTILSDVEVHNVSSSQIREMIAQKKDTTRLLHHDVATYIASHRLYS